MTATGARAGLTPALSPLRGARERHWRAPVPLRVTRCPDARCPMPDAGIRVSRVTMDLPRPAQRGEGWGEGRGVGRSDACGYSVNAISDTSAPGSRTLASCRDWYVPASRMNSVSVVSASRFAPSSR